jgi:hypothetical protein
VDQWSIDVASWVLVDSGYGDLRCGQEIRFAVDCVPYLLDITAPSAPNAVHITGALYDVRGAAVFVTDGVWVIDFGLLAYAVMPLPQGVKVGTWVTGRMALSIGASMDLAIISEMRGVPPLSYRWRIDRILRKTGPFIKDTSAPPGYNVVVRDPSRLSYEEIEQTNLRRDDDCNADYVLCCTLLEALP